MTRSIARLRPPLYPIAFPVAFLVNFWTASTVHPGGLARSLLVAVGVGLVVCVVAGLIAGRTRGGLAASAVLVGFIAPAQSPAAIALFAGALVVLLVGVVRRDSPPSHEWLINRVMLTLTSIVLLAVGIKVVAGGSLGIALAEVQLTASPRGPVEPPASRPPDIVMVMLDGFPGDAAAALAPAAGSLYDADAFPDALTDLGFHVQRNSHSNYLLTPMTLASMFDMRHLADESGITGLPQTGGSGPLRRILNESAALEILHAAGYEIVWVDSGFNHAEVRRVDRWIDHGMPNELELRVLVSTYAGRLVSAVAPDLFSGLQRERVLQTIADATLLIDEPHDRPRFVFVHVPSPHSPWVFGSDGEPKTEPLESFHDDRAAQRGIDRHEAIRRVFAQAAFVGDRTSMELAGLVDRPAPPVVIVFSDHGPGTDISFSAPVTTDLVERTSNFLATFTPGKPDLYDEYTTPVNILSTLVTGYLGVDVPRQPDTIYAWSESGGSLFPVVVPGTNSR